MFCSHSVKTVLTVCPWVTSISVQNPYEFPRDCPALLRQVGIRIFDLDNWLVLAHSLNLLHAYRDLVLRILSWLGLRVN